MTFRLIALLSISAAMSGCFSYSSTHTEPAATSTTVTRTTQTSAVPVQTTTTRSTTY